MSVEPLVSVVIPNYNSEKYIEECLNSILQQSYNNIEVIVVDDKSTDDSVSIIRERFMENHNVSVIELPVNGGPASARNVGVSKAKGEYIAFMDADDISDKSRIKKQIERIHKDKSDICVSPLQNFGMGRSHISKIGDNQEALRKISLLKCPFPQPSVLGKAEIFKSNLYDEGIRAEDYELWGRLLPKYKFSVCSEPLIFGRNHATSMSTTHLSTITAETHAIRVSALKGYGINLTKAEESLLLNAYSGDFSSVASLVDIANLFKKICDKGYTDKFVEYSYNDQLYWIYRRNVNLGFSLFFIRHRIPTSWKFFGFKNELKLLYCITNSWLKKTFK